MNLIQSGIRLNVEELKHCKYFKILSGSTIFRFYALPIPAKFYSSLLSFLPLSYLSLFMLMSYSVPLFSLNPVFMFSRHFRAVDLLR